MIYCSVKYCCSNSSIPGVILHSIKIPNHPAYHWSTLWPLEVCVRGLYHSWWFCVHKLSMFIYLSLSLPITQIPFCSWSLSLLQRRRITSLGFKWSLQSHLLWVYKIDQLFTILIQKCVGFKRDLKW